jgi:hypothetical protein
LLILIAEFVVVVSATTVLTAETELMAFTCFFESTSLWIKIVYPKNLRIGYKQIRKRLRLIEDEAEAAPCDASSGSALVVVLGYWTSFNTAC